MKRFVLTIAACGIFFPCRGWALTEATGSSAPPAVGVSTSAVLPPALSTGPVMVVVTTHTETFADFGETISTPTPSAMTQPPGATPFVTLTRTLDPTRPLPANATIVYPDEARTYDAQNAGEMLEHEAGLLIQPQGGSYPLYAAIRGGSPNETLVLIDGRPIEGASLGPGDLTEIPIEQIDHIEIVRGGLSSLYGPNALGGVVNIITKRATYNGVPLSHVSYESASYSRQTYRLDYGSRKGPLDYFFFGNQQWESGFRDNTDQRQYNIGGNAGISMGKKGKLLFDAGSLHDNAGVPGFRCDDIQDPSCPTSTMPLEPNRFNNKDEKGASTPTARQITDSNYFRTSYLVGLSSNVYMAARFFGHEREEDYDDSFDPNPANIASTDRREHSNGGELQFNLPLGLMAGGNFTHDAEDFLDRITPDNSFSAHEQNWGAFAQQTWRWDALTIIPSGRYDKNSQFGGTSNPRVQGLLEANDWLRFSASAGRSFRAPTIDEVMPMPSRNYLGNPDLLPETAWSYDAGFELHESSKSLRANYFLANIQNTIQTFVPQDPSNPDSPLVAVNLDHSRRQGAEVEFRRVVSAKFHDAWNYTYLENVGTPAGYDHLVSLAYSPRHTANYLATYIFDNPRWSIDSTLRYEDARYSGNDNTGTKMGGQVILDLRLAYQWRQMEWFLGVNDVTDKRYEEQPGYPLPGSTVFMGLKVRLWG